MISRRKHPVVKRLKHRRHRGLTASTIPERLQLRDQVPSGLACDSWNVALGS